MGNVEHILNFKAKDMKKKGGGETGQPM